MTCLRSCLVIFYVRPIALACPLRSLASRKRALSRSLQHSHDAVVNGIIDMLPFRLYDVFVREPCDFYPLPAQSKWRFNQYPRTKPLHLSNQHRECASSQLHTVRPQSHHCFAHTPRRKTSTTDPLPPKIEPSTQRITTSQTPTQASPSKNPTDPTSHLQHPPSSLTPSAKSPPRFPPPASPKATLDVKWNH